MEYIAYLHKDRDSDYGVSFPDFPGCVTQGDTAQEALENAVEALALHIEAMVSEGEVLPPASSVDEPLPDWLRDIEMPTQGHAVVSLTA